jgi:hypothetical protein
MEKSMWTRASRPSSRDVLRHEADDPAQMNDEEQRNLPGNEQCIIVSATDISASFHKSSTSTESVYLRVRLVEVRTIHLG